MKELTYEDVMKDEDYRYFYQLLSTNYKARLDPELAVARYYIDNYRTTNILDMGKNNVPRYEKPLRKMYRVKSVFHCCQPTEEDKELLKSEQEKYKEINRNTVVKTLATQTLLF